MTGHVTLFLFVCNSVTLALRLGGMDAQADMRPGEATGDQRTTIHGAQPSSSGAVSESLAAEVTPGGTISVGQLYRMIKPPAAAQKVPEAGPPGQAVQGTPEKKACLVGPCSTALGPAAGRFVPIHTALRRLLLLSPSAQ